MDEYETSNHVLAAVLSLNGLEPDNLRLHAPKKRVIFVYVETDVLRSLVREFEDGRTMVEPVSFMNHLTRVRRTLFAFKDGAGIGRG